MKDAKDPVTDQEILDALRLDFELTFRIVERVFGRQLKSKVPHFLARLWRLKKEGHAEGCGLFGWNERWRLPFTIEDRNSQKAARKYFEDEGLDKISVFQREEWVERFWFAFSPAGEITDQRLIDAVKIRASTKQIVRIILGYHSPANVSYFRRRLNRLADRGQIIKIGGIWRVS